MVAVLVDDTRSDETVAARAPKRLGRIGDRCSYSECHVPVAVGAGFRVLPMQVYCSEEHAALDQMDNPI